MIRSGGPKYGIVTTPPGVYGGNFLSVLKGINDVAKQIKPASIAKTIIGSIPGAERKLKRNKVGNIFNEAVKFGVKKGYGDEFMIVKKSRKAKGRKRR